MDSDTPKASDEERLRGLNQALESRDRELAILASVASRIHGEEEVDTILSIAIDEILDQMQLKAAWVFMGDGSDRRLSLAASRGVSPSYLEEIRVEGLGECLCPEVFRSGHRMQAQNTTQCPRMPTIVDGLQEPVAHACIPLCFEGRSRGVLNVAARPGERFSDRELRFLDTLGLQVCLAVERALHLRAERQRSRESRALAAINSGLGGSLDVAAVLEAVGRTGRELLGAERAAIFLGDDREALSVAHLSGLPHPELEEGDVVDLRRLGSGLQARALDERRLMFLDDWPADPGVSAELARRWGIASGIVAPLLARNEILGLLLLTSGSTHHWTEEQVDVAEALASQASVALDNARLYQEARRAYEALRHAQEQRLAAEKMAVLGTFASGLAHEVRNPLNSIALQLSILERRTARLEPALTRELRDLIGIIRGEIRRLDSLVGDFLLFSKASRVDYRPADLDALVGETLALLQPAAQAAGVSLKRQQGGEPLPHVEVDAGKIKQVLLNLLQNAIEALPRGGTVVLESARAEGRVRLSVRDDGPGLPEGLDIFQVFVTTKAKGTGLGLSIAQRIVMQHGGELVASSEKGKGATFTVLLPLDRAESAPQKASTT